MQVSYVPEEIEATAEREIYLGVGAPTEVPQALRHSPQRGVFWPGFVLRRVAWVR